MSHADGVLPNLVTNIDGRFACQASAKDDAGLPNICRTAAKAWSKIFELCAPQNGCARSLKDARLRTPRASKARIQGLMDDDSSAVILIETRNDYRPPSYLTT